MSSTPTAAFLATLPEFQSPQRIPALYSDIAPRKQSNPTAYQSTVSFWQRTLEALLLRGLQTPDAEDGGNKLVLHVDDALLDRLRWPKVTRPLGVGCAVVRAFVIHTQFSTY